MANRRLTRLSIVVALGVALGALTVLVIARHVRANNQNRQACQADIEKWRDKWMRREHALVSSIGVAGNDEPAIINLDTWRERHHLSNIYAAQDHATATIEVNNTWLKRRYPFHRQFIEAVRKDLAEIYLRYGLDDQRIVLKVLLPYPPGSHHTVGFSRSDESWIEIWSDPKFRSDLHSWKTGSRF